MARTDMAARLTKLCDRRDALRERMLRQSVDIAHCTMLLMAYVLVVFLGFVLGRVT